MPHTKYTGWTARYNRRSWYDFRIKWKKLNPPPYTCALCSEQINADEEVSLDHIIPVSKRPDLVKDMKNIQPTHFKCNLRKGNGEKRPKFDKGNRIKGLEPLGSTEIKER